MFRSSSQRSPLKIVSTDFAGMPRPTQSLDATVTVPPPVAIVDNGSTHRQQTSVDSDAVVLSLAPRSPKQSFPVKVKRRFDRSNSSCSAEPAISRALPNSPPTSFSPTATDNSLDIIRSDSPSNQSHMTSIGAVKLATRIGIAKATETNLGLLGQDHCQNSLTVYVPTTPNSGELNADESQATQFYKFSFPPPATTSSSVSHKETSPSTSGSVKSKKDKTRRQKSRPTSVRTIKSGKSRSTAYQV